MSERKDDGEREQTGDDRGGDSEVPRAGKDLVLAGFGIIGILAIAAVMLYTWTQVL